MRTALHFIFVPVLVLWGCGGGEFSSTAQPAGTGGTSDDASAGTGGSGGEAGTGGAAGSSTGGAAGSSTGGSGTGGTAGSSTGGTGGAAPCSVASDCPGPDNECTIKTCDNQVCEVTFVDADTPTDQQNSGDCKQSVCDGQGAIKQNVDDADLPDDGNPCTSDECHGGVPSNVKKAADTPCGTELKCDADGHCIGCVAPQDCGPAGPCFEWKCEANACVKEAKSDGLKCGTCQQCKTGACTNVESGKDPNNECADVGPCGTDGTCNGGGACRLYPNGQPCGTPPVCVAGTATLQAHCDGGGTCVPGGTVKCDPYRCDGNVCAKSCTGITSCAAGYYCTPAHACEDCMLCGEWYQNPTVTTLQACPSDSASLIQALKDCACVATGGTTACSNQCAGNGNLCSINPGPPDAECKTCVEAKCESQRDACLADQVN